uniref:Uncharacterized protein n=1 Tax=Anguilla anguilla TaxID=7936 RepID=A0A0E9REX2_ANGAN
MRSRVMKCGSYHFISFCYMSSLCSSSSSSSSSFTAPPEVHLFLKKFHQP